MLSACVSEGLLPAGRIIRILSDHVYKNNGVTAEACALTEGDANASMTTRESVWTFTHRARCKSQIVVRHPEERTTGYRVSACWCNESSHATAR